MFKTPPNRVLTRRQRERIEKKSDCVSLPLTSSNLDVTAPARDACSNISPRQQDSQGLKEEKIEKTSPSAPDRSSKSVRSAATSARTKKSTASSLARRKQLELEAAEARAKIQLELINKRLELELARADVEDGNDKNSECSEQQIDNQVHQSVEKWLRDSEVDANCAQEDLVEPATTATVHVSAAPATNLPANSIEQLAHTLRDVMEYSSTQREERLLSRLATPRELPTFSGDCIEWLHFKCAYEESSSICRYSDSENLWRLRRALRGDAREAVTDLLIGNTLPAVIMEALELRFGRSDLIIANITCQLKRLPALPTNYQQELINFSIKINNCVATIRALKQEDYLRSPELATAIISKLPNTLIGKWTDYAYKKILDGCPKLELMATFLKQEAEMMSIVGLTLPHELRKISDATDKRSPEKKVIKRSVFTTVTRPKEEQCKYCRKSMHTLPECRLFKRAMRKDKWRFVKNHGLCYCCLIAHHDKETCPGPVCDVDNCGLRHHKLLHWNKPTLQTTDENENIVACSTQSTVAHVASDGTSASKIVLKVVLVKLKGLNSEVTAYALLDDAASVSMIDSELADSLGLTNQPSSAIKFVDAFGLEVIQSDAPKVSARISNCNDSSSSYDIIMRKVSQLNLPVQDLSVINNIRCKHLLSVKECVCKERVKPQLLIGEDNYHLIAPLEIIPGSKYKPYATRCRLGWTIHGYCGRTHTHDCERICTLSHIDNVNELDNIENINQLLKESFALESIGISPLCRENTAHLRAIQILDETSRQLGNQWEVGLPFKRDNFTMPDSYCNANSRMKNLMKKFKLNNVYAERYRSEVNKLFTEGYARVIGTDAPVSKHVWYVPHFGVQNVNKPEKLRLVFDAAAKVEGVCLNDYLWTGPDLYNSLLGIMLRFRENEIVIMGDIKDMFLRIKIRAEDQNVLRFLWQESDNSPVQICVMQSLIFGATCSPFIAQYIRNKNAIKYEDLYPEAVKVIINNHYMDDCLYSTSSTENAIQLIKNITAIHKQGGFEIRGWSSNSREVVSSVPHDALARSAVLFKHGAMNTTERTLGLMWHPAEDCFRFNINYDRIPSEILNGLEPPTKSKMLSIIMSIYDIHGFLSPFIIKSRIILQNVHRSGVDWNCRIQPREFDSWKKWLDELKVVKSLSIPRWYNDAGAWTQCYPCMPNLSNERCLGKIQMHTFCDASIKAYAAAIYLRFIRADGYVNICFVSGKSRVTPLRPVSIPRLELQGALLAARLASTIQKEHKDLKIDERFFWTDSSTVLIWIRSDPRSFKPYVAHRLGELDELTKVSEWRYVPSSSNVADIATREDSEPLTYTDPWFQGPAFLRQPKGSWPKDFKKAYLPETALCEERNINFVTANETEPFLIDENKFSSWLRLLRSIASVLLFIKKCRKNKHAQLDVELLTQAEIVLLKKSQRDSFYNEIECLKLGKSIKSNSRLSNLTPYLDESGVLRVGGRTDRADGVLLSATRPVILDGKHKITRLIVEYHHRRALHGANELVVNELRQRYWILKLRPTVRAVAASCLLCRYRRATPRAQRMADLPAARLQHHRRPFAYTGVDFFGPMEVTVGRRREKRYGVLFTCLTVRAIHIEITDSLSADATIMALRRMIGRRGTPSVIYSDNGTNFRGAATELQRSLSELNLEKIRSDCLIRGIQWNFIPPGAPEMGGAWERLIRSVKTALKVVLKERAPRPETLFTLLVEVEALVNSRPITHVSTEPNYPEALTPNHFLLGTSSSGPLIGKYDNSDLCLRKQWRIAQRLADMFWGRWVKEYLPTLLPRQKWTDEERSLQIGDYVILVESNLERGSWRHGIVSATHAGHDGRVRVVDVRTRTGTLRRPVTRVALLSPAECSADITD